ncbi:hypothetical protein [Aquitalea magnusonii]|uniref:Molecular chaperone n=1 Tax=Aquitalea magnusonii TaxID=332411 RepID=A0A318JIF0_9NEIS|nr:hypothetical protein [Aquitalea magnusonii]PXX49842.1 hypothetical protein DFR38_10315 [Aquitalea magnusonii]
MQLALPALDRDPRLVDTNPDSVASWVERLPYSDLQECGRLLLEALRGLSRTPMEVGNRHKLLLHYLKGLDRYYPALESEIVQTDLTSVVRTRQLAMLGAALFESIFVAFKLTLSERLAKRGLLEREHQRIELLLYTMMAARQLLNICCQSYSPPPAHFWQDCHQLYSFALARGWQEKQLEKDDSLELIYRQILLLGLTSTNRLSMPELLVTKQLIMDLSRQTVLLPVEALKGTVHGYLVDSSRDEPPRFLRVQSETLEAACYLLDLSQAITVLTHSVEQLTRLQNTSHSPSQVYDELALLQSLAAEWQQPRRRRHPRLPMQEVIELISTIPAIWYRCNGMSWVQAGNEQAAPPASTRAPPAPSLFVVVNQSATGFLLRGQPRGQTLRAGEAILLTRPGKPDTAQLCMICWVSLLPDGIDVECGVEVIGKQPAAVMLIPSITHPADTPQFALRLPAIASLHRPPLLLTQGRLFSRLREFRLWDEAGESLIRSSRLDRQSPHFQLMEFRASEYF